MELQRVTWVFENGSAARVSSYGVWLDAAQPAATDAVSACNATMVAAAPAATRSWEDISPTNCDLLKVTTQRFETTVVPVSPKYPYGLRWTPTTVEYESNVDRVVGPASTPGLPPQCSQVVSVRTDLPGRRHRGRVYLQPCADVTATNAGVISSAQATANAATILAWVNAFIADLADGTWVVASIADQAESLHSPFFQEVTGVRGDVKIGTVRKRQGRVG